ncbi:hypothetical protein VTP01DRAFT_1952 [Rhizomucor pusillus]|uniref:uncharacterized protein n=1 Tax=Rhizomucor pusillus TaxID=4840 RepID=UPI0037445CFF
MYHLTLAAISPVVNEVEMPSAAAETEDNVSSVDDVSNNETSSDDSLAEILEFEQTGDELAYLREEEYHQSEQMKGKEDIQQDKR